MNTPFAREMNLDGLVGPTHNYAGLSVGNLASRKHGLSVSRPRQAALQGLAKMKFLADLGIAQGVLPPQPRPDFGALRRLGFGGTDQQMIARAHEQSPRLLSSVYSASSMWAANAATVSPSADTADGRVHFTPANLVSQFHRSLEPPVTGTILKAIFADEKLFAHHDPLPAAPYLGDEGAANHTRLGENHGGRGVEIFVHGTGGTRETSPARFPARQTLEASRAIARLHGLDPARTIFTQQSPAAIDAGAFHNDVVAVGNENVLLYQAGAYANRVQFAGEICAKFSGRVHLIEVAEDQISLADAIQTYLFNSQLVTLPDGLMSLIAPIECQERQSVRDFIAQLIESDNPIRSAHFLDVRQSMKNGGGPACLRLRVVLTPNELAGMHQGVVLTAELYDWLTDWVERHYRETLAPADLGDPSLARESMGALDELTGILRLGAIYDFQK